MLDRAGRVAWLMLLLALVLPAPLLAHTGAEAAGSGFATGFVHPLGGLDHVLAMLAVGMWGAQLGNPALWVLPVAFPMVMALGGAAGIVGLPLPAVELGVRLSVIALGGVIALDLRPPLAAAAVLVGFFAIFHGWAHGVELPGRTGAVPYSAGFVTATGLIHLSGIGIGLVVLLPRGRALLRAGGGLIVVAGLLLTGQLLLG